MYVITYMCRDECAVSSPRIIKLISTATGLSHNDSAVLAGISDTMKIWVSGILSTELATH